MNAPTVLDGYCCQGGASRGYELAGFEIKVGVDLAPQPRYPYPFVQADAIRYLADHGHGYTLRHASPPCQLDSDTWRINKREHPDLIGPTRDALLMHDGAWVIENVEAARPKLRNPILLCGAMFGLRMYRHRLFEANFPLPQPYHPPHVARQAKMGRPVLEGEYLHMVGNFSGVDLAREITGCDWMTRDGLRESIPPAYTQFIGEQLLAHLAAVAA